MIMQQLRKLPLLFICLILSSCSTILKQDQEVDINEPNQITKPVQNWSTEAKNSFELANTLIKTDAQKAISEFQETILLEPKMEAAYYNLLRLLYETNSDVTNNEEQMELIMTKANDKSILSARMLTLSATSLREKGKFKAAEKSYSQALEEDANHLAALANMGILQDLYLGNLSFALYYYQQYQEQLRVQNKEDKRVVNWLADIKQRIKRAKKENG